jgi:hypothetical protein
VLTATSVLIFSSCVQTFLPPPSTTAYNYLVIDGFINAGYDSTYITLTRTATLSDSSQIKPESGATLTIEGNNNTSYRLYENSAGHYSCGPFNASNTAKFRLHILTALGIEYASDYVTPLYAPPIDSVNWTNTKGLDSGVTIYVNAHNDVNASRYYRWICYETWEFHPAFESLWGNEYYLNQLGVPSSDYLAVYTCWHSDTSNNLLLGTTAELSQNIISQIPLVFLPDSSWKISLEYSVLVEQQVIDANTYSYFQVLQKNTEQLGTLFDVQPSSQAGNFHCLTNPAATVIGYIYASSTTSSRIFINNNQVPGWYKESNSCEQYPSGGSDDQGIAEGIIVGTGYAVIDSVDVKLVTEAVCGICTLSGTNVEPSYWPN